GTGGPVLSPRVGGAGGTVLVCPGGAGDGATVSSSARSGGTVGSTRGASLADEGCGSRAEGSIGLPPRRLTGAAGRLTPALAKALLASLPKPAPALMSSKNSMPLGTGRRPCALGRPPGASP